MITVDWIIASFILIKIGCLVVIIIALWDPFERRRTRKHREAMKRRFP